MKKKSKVILRPYRLGSKGFFTGVINLKNRSLFGRFGANVTKIAITKNWRIVYGDEDISKIDNNDLWMFQFNDTRRVFEIEWDSSPEASQYDKNQANIVALLSKHEQIEVKYGDVNENLAGTPEFVLEFDTDKKTIEANQILKKQAVLNKYLGFELDEMCTCAYDYGLNASKFTAASLMTAMVEPTSGLLMSNAKRHANDHKSKSFIESFIEDYEKGDDTTKLRSTAQKAIMSGKVKREKAGYYYESQFIGGEIDNVVTYLFDNKEVYDYLKKELDANLIENDMDVAIKKPANTFDELAELNALRKKAGSLRIKGYNMMKKENLIKAINEVEAGVAQVVA